ncbi:MAG: hypothetical protein Q9N34_04885 [Aquificota bacterium]|nr:hypothetical protein [Aquificota bacterium]
MFLLKKVVSYFILPPGLYVLILLFIGLLSRRRSFVRFLSLSSALFLYLISVEPFKDLLYYPLERGLEVPEEAEG